MHPLTLSDAPTLALKYEPAQHIEGTTMVQTGRLTAIPYLASFRRGLAVIIAVFAAVGAPSRAMSAEFSPQVWVTPGIYAWHFNRSKDLRDDNVGLGAEVALAEDHSVMAGTYINSVRARTHYAAYAWRPLHWQPADLKVGAGILIGAFDGYGYKDGAWFVAPLPVLSIEGRYLGVNLSIIPTIKNRLDGAFAIQVKVRVW